MYLIVFTEIKAASNFVRSGLAPLALMVRFGSGRLLEIDLGLNDEGEAITPAIRNFLPLSSSALIVKGDDLRALDERLAAWEHVVHSL